MGHTTLVSRDDFNTHKNHCGLIQPFVSNHLIRLVKNFKIYKWGSYWQILCPKTIWKSYRLVLITDLISGIWPKLHLEVPLTLRAGNRKCKYANSLPHFRANACSTLLWNNSPSILLYAVAINKYYHWVLQHRFSPGELWTPRLWWTHCPLLSGGPT